MSRTLQRQALLASCIGQYLGPGGRFDLGTSCFQSPRLLQSVEYVAILWSPTILLVASLLLQVFHHLRRFLRRLFALPGDRSCFALSCVDHHPHQHHLHAHSDLYITHFHDLHEYFRYHCHLAVATGDRQTAGPTCETCETLRVRCEQTHTQIYLYIYKYTWTFKGCPMEVP